MGCIPKNMNKFNLIRIFLYNPCKNWRKNENRKSIIGSAKFLELQDPIIFDMVSIHLAYQNYHKEVKFHVANYVQSEQKFE